MLIPPPHTPPMHLLDLLLPKNFGFQVRSQVIKFVNEDIVPNMAEYGRQKKELLALPKYANDKEMGHLRCPQPPIVKELREKAKAAGLYNFFLPEVTRWRMGGARYQSTT